MPNDQPETLAVILSEMRKAVVPMICGRPKIEAVSIRDVLQWADRVEAAAKREEDRRRDEVLSLQRTIVKMQDAIARQADAVNAASLRAALEQALAYCESDQKSGIAYSDNDVLVPMLRSALAAPARNCDVGTAEEQAERHGRFCAAHYKADAVDAQCFGCPASDKKETDCEFVWGQLPFAPAEGGDNG